MAPPAIDSSSPAATDAPLPGDHLLAVDAKNVVICASARALALRGVEVRSEAQKIHALIGANGAGKSTLSRYHCGSRRTDRGTGIDLRAPPQFRLAACIAHQLGVAAIYQELTIVPAMSTQANVFLGQTISRFGLAAKRRDAPRKYLRLCERLGVSIPPDVPAGRLAIADQQMLEIMRGIRSRKPDCCCSMSRRRRLAPPECDGLLRIMRDLKGHGVRHDVCRSHKLEEVLEIADPRDGIPRR